MPFAEIPRAAGNVLSQRTVEQISITRTPLQRNTFDCNYQRRGRHWVQVKWCFAFELEEFHDLGILRQDQFHGKNFIPLVIDSDRSR